MRSTTAPKSVLISAHALQRNFLPPLARRLKERCSCQIHLVCTGPVRKRFYKAFGDAFDSIAVVGRDRAPASRATLDEDAVFAEARQSEERLGITYNELLTVDRHFGRGFALAGYGHPRSRLSEKTSYPEVVAIYNQRVALWDELLRSKNIDLIINAPRELGAVARAHGIAVRWMVRSRFGNYYYWAFDDRPMSPAIEARFSELPEDVAPPQEQDQPMTYQQGRQRFEIEHRNVLALGRNLARRVALHAYWHLKRSEKAKGYYLGEELRYLVRAWWTNRTLLSGRLARLSELDGKEFVYFPLQQEPEASISREYFFQLATIAQICRDLPAGVPLVVKETFFAMGRRPRDFYGQIMEFKNVIFMDPREPGLEVVRRAAVTVTIGGSAGHEAAVMGRPVITFGRYNHYNFLSHVKVIRDGTELKRHLHVFLRGDYDAERARRDGNRMLRALADVSFDMEDFDYIKAGTPRQDAVDRACDRLLESLAWHRPHPSVAATVAAGTPGGSTKTQEATG